jgi:signal transduction histidine kinase
MDNKYMNRIPVGAKKIGIISIILVIIISYGVFFGLQYMTENNIRNTLFEQQKQRQIESTKALSEDVSTDLDSIMARLQDLANSPTIQQGDLSSNKTKKIAEERYSQINSLADRLYITDKNNIIKLSLAPKGQQLFVDANISHLDSIRKSKIEQTPIFSNGYIGLDGKYRIAIVYPIIKRDTGEYIGLVTSTIPTVEFFARHGNVHDINSQFLVVYDGNATMLANGASEVLVGKNFFGDYTQRFIGHNQLLYNLTHNLLAGNMNYAVYNYGRGERLTTGYPVLLEGKPVYFIQIVTPTATIYSQVNDVLLTERISMFSLLAGTTAAVAVLILFLIKWNSRLDKEVKRRTKELEESNKQLTLANEQLHLHDKMQKEFINIAAHELRTPIQPLLSLTQIVRSKIKDAEQGELLDNVIRNAKRLQRLAEDILDITRIESRSLDLKKERFNLNDLILNVVQDYRNLLEKDNNNDDNNNDNNNNITLLYEFKNDGIFFVEADRYRLTQVISNLLNNAIKFIKEGGGGGEGGTISITLEKKEDIQEVLIAIKDSGTGIHSDILPRLFSKFATKSEKGTGLGLFISKSIVKAHGGRIWAENNSDGKGATFYLSLPLAIQDLNKEVKDHSLSRNKK